MSYKQIVPLILSVLLGTGMWYAVRTVKTQPLADVESDGQSVSTSTSDFVPREYMDTYEQERRLSEDASPSKTPLVPAEETRTNPPTSHVPPAAQGAQDDLVFRAADRGEAYELATAHFAEDIKSAREMGGAQGAGAEATIEVGAVDLNSDGAGEYMARLRSGYSCGTLGCPHVVFFKRGGAYVPVYEGIVQDMRVGTTSTRGMRDIVLVGNNQARTVEATWVWAGDRYVLGPNTATAHTYAPVLEWLTEAQGTEGAPQQRLALSVRRGGSEGIEVWRHALGSCTGNAVRQPFGTDAHFTKAMSYVHCWWAGGGYEYGVFERQEALGPVYVVERRDIGECGNVADCDGYGELTTMVRVPVREPFTAEVP